MDILFPLFPYLLFSSTFFFAFRSPLSAFHLPLSAFNFSYPLSFLKRIRYLSKKQQLQIPHSTIHHPHPHPHPPPSPSPSLNRSLRRPPLPLHRQRRSPSSITPSTCPSSRTTATTTNTRPRPMMSFTPHSHTTSGPRPVRRRRNLRHGRSRCVFSCCVHCA